MEGAPASVAIQKNYFSFDVNWTERQAIFATAEKKIVRVVNNPIFHAVPAQCLSQGKISLKEIHF